MPTEKPAESTQAVAPKSDDLRRDLIRPEVYPVGTDSVEMLETHASLLSFAGDFVYKVQLRQPSHTASRPL
ncbi:MAG: hypothetical protein ACI841_003489 [Planctomycetota bacterium]|jgi:hypothetical protein